jgi:cytoskeletal protein CcmA (bactofilin family)
MAESAKDGAVVGEEASLSGKFKGQDLLVLGRLEGELELRGRLRVGPKGSVRATVRAATIEVEGEVEGELRSDALSLFPTARVRGTFAAKRLTVQEGALVEGSINPASSRAPEPPPPPTPPPTPPPAPTPPANVAPPSEPKPEGEPPK